MRQLRLYNVGERLSRQIHFGVLSGASVGDMRCNDDQQLIVLDLLFVCSSQLI
jgi:hypothetical protein